MIYLLLAMQAAGMITDFFGTQNQAQLMKMGMKVQQAGIESDLAMTKLESQDASLQAMKQLRQTMGTQIATMAARGTAAGAGSAFMLFGGHIAGRQIELVSNERIVQAWRVVTWSPGVYSIARFELKEQGSSTKLVFEHVGFPEGQGQHLAEGWKVNYWEPLEKYLL